MCLASHFDIIESWKVIVGHSDIHNTKKKIKLFRMCGG